MIVLQASMDVEMNWSINDLNQRAAIAARSGVEAGIESLESGLKIKLNDLPDDQKKYFENKRAYEREAIDQLKAMRADLHERAFKAYLETSGE